MTLQIIRLLIVFGLSINRAGRLLICTALGKNHGTEIASEESILSLWNSEPELMISSYD